MDRIAACRTFVRAVEIGSFTRVAAEMNTTQPTVSKQIAALEDHLGTQLLVRTTRSLGLTEEGERYYEAVLEALDAFEAADAAAQGQQEVRGTLRVASPPAFGRLRIVPILKAFRASHPGAEFDLRLTRSELGPVELGVDLSIRFGMLRGSSLKAKRIGSSHAVFVTAPDHLNGHDGPEDPAALRAHICITDGSETGAQWPVRSTDGRPSVVEVSGPVRTNDMHAAALSGLGIARLPLWLVAADLADGRLVRLLEGHESEATAIHVVSPPRRHTPARVTAFVEHLAASLRDMPTLAM